jgi:hypothetical protein
MTTYLTRRGAPSNPVRTAQGSPSFVEAADDGAVIVSLGAPLRCLDCEGQGTLAQASPVEPTTYNRTGGRHWLLICDRCGAHWDWEPVAYYVLLDDSLRLDRGAGEHRNIGFGGGLGILAYFEQVSFEQPSCDHWADAADATREWIALMRAGTATQAQIDALLASIPAGSTMAEVLRVQVADWARRAQR